MILYDMCFFVAITLGVIIAVSGNQDSEVDVIWVGVFIGMFVWVFGLVAAVLLSKGRVNGISEKVWCIADTVHLSELFNMSACNSCKLRA